MENLEITHPLPTAADEAPIRLPVISNQNSLAPPIAPTRKARLAEMKLELCDAERAERIRLNPPTLLTLQEAAAFLCCSVRTIRQHINSRRISAAKIGGKVIIKRDTLLSDIDKLTLKSV